MAAIGSTSNINMPLAEQPLCIDASFKPTIQWWRFWYALYTRNASTVPYLVSTVLEAEGTDQDTALALTAEWNQVSVTPLNSGVKINSFGVGFTSQVLNDGANPLNVYPPVGSAIDALGANNPYILAVGKTQIFSQLTDTTFSSLQLG